MGRYHEGVASIKSQVATQMIRNMTSKVSSQPVKVRGNKPRLRGEAKWLVPAWVKAAKFEDESVFFSGVPLIFCSRNGGLDGSRVPWSGF